jgi:hypothetical protein
MEVLMSDEIKKSGDDKGGESEGFIGDLFSLASEGAALVKDIVKPARGTRVRMLEEEPYDTTIVFALRALVTECKYQGGIRIMIHENQIQVVVGEGISMRVTEGPHVGAAVLAMCDKEGIKLDGARFPKAPIEATDDNEK